MSRSRLRDEHYVSAKQMGRFLDDEIFILKAELEDGWMFDEPMLSISAVERIRSELHDTGILEILKNYQDYPEEEIATLLMIISEKSNTLFEEWAEIGKIIMAEMEPEPPTSGDIFEELYSPSRFDQENS